jgi:hypothetical protein
VDILAGPAAFVKLFRIRLDREGAKARDPNAEIMDDLAIHGTLSSVYTMDRA